MEFRYNCRIYSDNGQIILLNKDFSYGIYNSTLALKSDFDEAKTVTSRGVVLISLSEVRNPPFKNKEGCQINIILTMWLGESL